MSEAVEEKSPTKIELKVDESPLKVEESPPKVEEPINAVFNIDIELDDQQMNIKGLPLIGNKRIKINEETGEEALSYITDADLIRSDFDEYRALGVPSIDSFTIQETDINDL